MTGPPCVFLSCGEASGDAYVARIAEALLARRPDLRLVGVVGERGRAAGVEPWADMGELSVMGFVEILRHLPRLYLLGRRLEARAVREGVDLFLPVDFPGFHLRLAARLGHHGIPTLDFIPPKTWSWGRGRLRALRRHVERCAVIFPFEEQHYGEAGIEATFVGHPLVDLHARSFLEPDPERSGLLLVPGSRRQELRALVPRLARAVTMLRSRWPDLRVRVSRAPGVRREWLTELCDSLENIEMVEGSLFGHLRSSRVAVVCSGTATMEAALAGTPHVIVYRTGRLTYALARRLATVEHIGMANIVLGRRAFPELLQDELSPDAIADTLSGLFLSTEDGPAAKQRASCEELRQRLGGPGCFERVAALAVQRLQQV